MTWSQTGSTLGPMSMIELPDDVAAALAAAAADRGLTEAELIAELVGSDQPKPAGLDGSWVAWTQVTPNGLKPTPKCYAKPLTPVAAPERRCCWLIPTSGSQPPTGGHDATPIAWR